MDKKFKALSFVDHRDFEYECDICGDKFTSGGFSWAGGMLYVCSSKCVADFHKAMEELV